nr:zf-CCHC domain-containing protein/UBN2 domain-containing protein [Tanacetum cinerariifolium]
MFQEEESIDNVFARFNTIITSLKALDEGFSSKNYVRKFLRALHPKWRAKVTAIEESKDLTSLSLDELIENLKVYEVIIKKDSEMVKGKREQNRSLALKAKRNQVMKMVRLPIVKKKNTPWPNKDDKIGKSERKCFKCEDPNHLIEEYPKLSRNYNQRAFVRGSWSDSDGDDEEKTKDTKKVANMPRATVDDTSLTRSYILKNWSAQATPKAHLSYARRPQSDRGKARHSVSSTFAHHNCGSLSHQEDDDEDDGSSCASTPSHTTYLNSLRPLDYQQYDIPTSFEQNDDLLFERQNDLLNQAQRMHKELRGGFKSFGKLTTSNPSALHEIVVEVPNVEDIGGLENVKRVLHETVGAGGNKKIEIAKIGNMISKQVQDFPEPFFLKNREGETFAEVKLSFRFHSSAVLHTLGILKLYYWRLS